MASPREQYDRYANAFNKGTERIRQMQAAGQMDTPEYQRTMQAVKRIGAKVKEMRTADVIPDWQSGVLGAGSGLTMGGIDELTGAWRAATEATLEPHMYALTEKLSGRRTAPYHMLVMEQRERDPAGIQRQAEETPFMDRYKQYRDAARATHERARMEDPFMYGGGELAGALTTGMIAAPSMGLKAGAGTMQNLIPLMKTGGLYGGLGGLGYSEADPGQVAAEQIMQPGPLTPEQQETIKGEVGEAAWDVGGGTLMGAGLAPLLAGGGQVLRGAGKRLQRLTPGGQRREAFEVARQRNLEKYMDDMQRETGKSEAEIMDMLDIPGASLQEIGPGMRGEAAMLAKTPEAQDIIQEFNRTRNIETLERVYPQLREWFGLEGDNVTAALKELGSRNRRATKEAYDLAYSKPVEMTKPMLRELQSDFGQKAMQAAKKARVARRKNPDAINLTGAMQSTKDMDAILRDMSRQVALAYKPGPGKPAQTYAADLKKQYERFKNMVYKQNPEFAAARQQYGDEMSNRAAAKMGNDLFRIDAEELEMGIEGFTQGDHQLFQLGALKSILKELKKKPDESDLFKGLMNRPDKRMAIQLGFGNMENYRKFENMVRMNQEAFETLMATGANKPAVRAEAQDEARGLIRQLFELVPYSLTLKSGTGAARGAGAVGGATGEAVLPKAKNPFEALIREEQAKQLIQHDLNVLTQPKTMGGLFGTGVPETSKAAIPGLLGPGLMHGEEYGF